MERDLDGGPPTTLLWRVTWSLLGFSAVMVLLGLALWSELPTALRVVLGIFAILPLAAIPAPLVWLLARSRVLARGNGNRAEQAEARIDLLTTAAPDLMMYEASGRGELTYVSEGSKTLLGYKPREMVGRLLRDFALDDVRSLLPVQLGGSTVHEGLWKLSDGSKRTLQLAVQRHAKHGSSVFRGVARDVAHRVAVENELRETSQAFLDMLESAQNGILIVSRTGKVLIWNQSICDLLGVEPAELHLKTLNELVPDAGNEPLMPLVTARISGAAPAGRYERQLPRADGEVRDVEVSISTYPLGNGERGGWIEFSDITDRKRATDRIQELADYDHLTGLPNRQLMERSIAQVLERASVKKTSFAVMLMDLDRFKLVNDTLGHAVGDQLLQQVAARFVEALPPGAMVARFGGDEFLVLVPVLEDVEHAMHVAGALVAALEVPLDLDGRILHTATSVGVAVYPHDGEDAATLIRRADSAMYRSKELGGSGYQFATASLDADSHHRLNIENDLRAAIEGGELTVYYHPEVDIATGQIVRFEALVRWNHPERGLIPPLDFIPILEDNGLIRLVDEWVLRQACLQNQMWRAGGLGPVIVSVNMSARLFSNESMLDTIRAVLSETNMDPELLELEVTETAALNNVEEAVSMLSRLRDIGVRTALDDFGTGHSSLVRLKEFPLSTLKIDGSFVQSVTTDEDSGSIVSGVIALGHALGLTVVAEGVEHERQLSLLRHLGCDLAQGYLFARPLTSEAATMLLSEHKRLGQGYAA